MKAGCFALALALTAPAAPAEVRAPLPPRAFDRVEHLSLPAPLAAPLLPRPGGGAAALLGPPGAVGLIDEDGQLVTTWSVDAPGGGMAWWAGAEALHLVRGRDVVLSYGIDGTLRGRAVVGELLGGVAVPGTDDVVLALRSGAPALALRLNWDLSGTESFSARAGWRPAGSAPCVEARGAVWIAGGAGLLRLLPSVRQVPLVPGVRALYPRRGGGLIALSETAIHLLDADGRALGVTPLDAAVMDLVPRSDGGAALLLQSTPPTVLLVDAGGAARVRFEAPRDARALTVDDDGAVLVAARDGELAAFDPQGGPRWRMTLPARLRPPLVALSLHRFAIATEGAEVITLGASERARSP